ncbi:MAG: type II toxin-antitoxin system mRNA interferase toxin, RelE/StbE family [Candidatus Doudnabacteria bacterium]|nr:type II toxin-antitoxin system mRNA interferase toxin, RelE/StbE family [Candidatus Doudnabacteria bacterium]
MQIKSILYSSDFINQLKKLPENIKKLAVKKEALFKKNPLHPSLRLHGLKGKLSGLFSISLTLNYRIIFKRKDSGEIIFISIGKHDIYEHL